MPNENSPRGFAAMDRERQREIASKGGIAAHRQGSAHEFTPDEARVAGRKGGQSVSRNREHMAAIGRLGGEASGVSRNRAKRNRETALQGAGSSSGSNATGSSGMGGNSGQATAASGSYTSSDASMTQSQSSPQGSPDSGNTGGYESQGSQEPSGSRSNPGL